MDKSTLDKINALTRRDFKAEELYAFPVTMCGNEIDRDFERFSDDALDEMAGLFVGKTGIFDHNPRADNQAARIFDTEVITVPDKETAWGGVYRYLKGFAYMVRTASNADLIKEIDAGIKKEVSVNCAAARRICSVCGANRLDTQCEHVKGKTYGGVLCTITLDGISDAYEWSFVAVPAQRGAGVTKLFGGDPEINKEGGIVMEEFTPITTQKDFDTAAAPLIEAAVTAKAAEFEGWVSPADAEALRKQLETLTAERDAMQREALRKQAALDAGIPVELADRLTGETAEALAADAAALAKLFDNAQPATPMFEAEINGTPDTVEGDLLEMLRNLKD